MSDIKECFFQFEGEDPKYYKLNGAGGDQYGAELDIHDPTGEIFEDLFEKSTGEEYEMFKFYTPDNKVTQNCILESVYQRDNVFICFRKGLTEPFECYPLYQNYMRKEKLKALT
jgi:hypothetical protein